MIFYTRFSTPVSDIMVVGNEEGLQQLRFVNGQDNKTLHIDDQWQRNDSFFDPVKEQVRLYCKRKLQHFDVKLNISGTDFQKRVWQELRKIPYGQVTTYGQIARQLGNKNSSRAVGMANSKNPLPLIVPCHRVIGTDGSMTGFSSGIALKKKLLAIEDHSNLL